MPLFNSGVMASFMMFIMFIYLAPIFPLLYVIVKWRGQSATAGAGTHGLMMYFATVSVLIGLSGAAILTYGAISIGDTDPELTRTAWGLLVGSLAFCLLNVVLLRTGGPLRDPTDVVRVFVGFVALLSGMIAMIALIGMTIAMFQDATSERAIRSRSNAIRAFGSAGLYYLATYLLTTRLLSRNAVQSQTTT